MREFDLSPFQRRALLAPEDCNLALLGGRGGGKSWALVALALRHVEEHGDRARALLIRKSFPALRDVELTTRALFAQVYGTAASFNAQAHLWRFPSGATLELGCYEGESDFARYHGRSTTLLLVDEAQEWADPAALDLLRSNLRGAGVPLRVVLAANPGGAGNAWLWERFYAHGQAEGEPFLDSQGASWLRLGSTLADNPFLDREGYEANLRAATASDPELQRAWLEGDFAVQRGAFFSGVLSQRSAIAPWRVMPPNGFATFLAYDHGSAAPAVAFVALRSKGATGPDGRFYPRGSLILLDEVSVVDPGSWARGLGLTVPEIAERILRMARRWGVPAQGVADPAIFSRHGAEAGSIAAEFARAGVTFYRADNNRAAGWSRLRSLAQQAGASDRPGLYVSTACEGFWRTVPSLPRDAGDPEDVDSDSIDHWADAARYATREEGAALRVEPMRW